MAYGSKSTDHELTQLQSEVTNEVHRDAEHLATSVFGAKNTHPDLARVDNSLLDARYRTAYEQQDREWLTKEAQRDPLQFLEVSQRLGAYIPPAPPPASAPIPTPPPIPALGPPAPVAAAPFGGAAVAATPPVAPPLLPPPPAPALPMGPPGPPSMATPGVVPMAQGGLVTEPTLALIGENGPEMVTPLTQGAPTVPAVPWQRPDPVIDPLDSRYYAQAVNTAVPIPGQPKPGEIEAYIRQAAAARGIDPEVALRVAFHEGGRDPKRPELPAFVDPAIEARFNTGRSWWPFQLHYGGRGYEQYGDTAGIGNDFTRDTGWKPGDPRAWQAATDYALEEVLRTGWQKFYGRGPANVGVWQGVPQQAIARAPVGQG